MRGPGETTLSPDDYLTFLPLGEHVNRGSGTLQIAQVQILDKMLIHYMTWGQVTQVTQFHLQSGNNNTYLLEFCKSIKKVPGNQQILSHYH